MNKLEMSEALLTAKIKKGVDWETMAADIGVGSVWLASVCMGKNSAKPAIAAAIAEYLGLDAQVANAIEAYPTKVWDQKVATDPFIYRFYEIAGVFGDSIKAVTQEKFGDGIMSAIDFSVNVDKEADPKGDRVVITLNGKFLPYKAW